MVVLSLISKYGLRKNAGGPASGEIFLSDRVENYVPFSQNECCVLINI